MGRPALVVGGVEDSERVEGTMLPRVSCCICLWDAMGTNVVSSMRLFLGFQGVAGAAEHAAN